MRGLATRLALFAVLAHAAIHFGAELRAWHQVRTEGLAPAAPVVTWRWDTAPVEAFRRFMDAGRAVLPRGTVVALASADDACGAAFYRRLWAGYLAPELDLTGEAETPRQTRWLLAYGVVIERAGTTRVRDLPGGALYRNGPP